MRLVVRSSDGRWGGATDGAAGKSGERLPLPMHGVLERVSSEERCERAPHAGSDGFQAAAQQTGAGTAETEGQDQVAAQQTGTGMAETEKQGSKRCTGPCG